jgi:small subunit ribosomal protein S6
MSKTKSSVIPHYELLYIIANKYTEDEVKPIVENVNKIIGSAGGTITYSENWGKKKMCYPISHFGFGYYHLAEFDCPGVGMETINRSLRMSNEVLRHMIVAKPIKSELNIKKEKAISEKIANKAAEHLKQEQEQEQEKELEKTKGKVNLIDLDEKLDKILDTDDLLS